MNDGSRGFNQAALAKALGVSQATVTKGKSLGMPVSSLAEALAWRRAHLHPAHVKLEPGQKRPDNGKVRPPLKTETTDDGKPAETVTDFQQARTSREIFAAKTAQLEYEQSVGRLVDAEAVRREYAKAIVLVRDQFLRLPDRLAPMLVGLGDIDTVKRLIMVEVRAALAQFTGAN